MKTRIILLLALVASVNSFAAAASDATVSRAAVSRQNIPYGFVVRNVTPDENTVIARGDTSMMVRRLLGTPFKTLSRDVWVYSGYSPESSDEAAAYGCNSLLVTFANGKVIDLKIVNLKATQIIAANLSRTASIPQIALATQ